MSETHPDEQAIFEIARNIDSAEVRQAYLMQMCGNDLGLQQRVQALLDAFDESASFLESAPSEIGISPTLDKPITEKPGTQIGPYKLLEQIGEGGMGVVYMAEQKQPMKRRVALKIIKPGMDTRQVIARFEAERQALAMMDHPNIAKVLDAGQTESGRPYFVMELVNGISVTKYCDEQHLTPKERLNLFVHICQAVQHAHQKGIIHRDLKPSNVLVALYDGTAVPKVIDFGVAKATNQSLTEKTMFTQLGQIVGTLEYMSPEQAERNQLDVDTRSDIYSLGVILYELLVGETPFDSKKLRSAAFEEMLRMIREDEPSKPSTKLSSSESLPSIAANRRVEPQKLGATIRGELDWIVMKALEKDRGRRYETASAFADDVQNYLNDEAVQACPPSAGYKLRKFVHRNKGRLATFSLIAAALLVAVGGIGWAVRDRVAREKEIARENEAREQKTAREIDARQARTSSQIELILEEVKRLEQEQEWPEALASAKRAEAIVSNAETKAELGARVKRTVEGLALVIRLEEARMVCAGNHDGGFDYVGSDRAFRQAFTDAGLLIDELTVEQAAERLGPHSQMAVQFAISLTEWSLVKRHSEADKDPTNFQHLLAVADAIDPDPWRRKLRAITVLKKGTRGKELQVLAASVRSNKLSPTTLATLGRYLMFEVSPMAAVNLLRPALDQYPDDFWLNFQMGHYLDMLPSPQTAEATAFCRAAVALRPDSASARNNLGESQRRQGKLDEAIVTLQISIQLDPNLAVAHNSLGVVFKEQGKLEEAVACYRLAIQLDPNLAVAHNNLGTVFMEQGRLEEAVACYRLAIQLDPNLAIAHNNLGAVFKEQGKLDEAMESCHKAIELDPNSAVVYTNLGVVLKAVGKLEEAIAALQTAIQLDPKFAGAYNNLGIALAEQGKFDEAIKFYSTGIQLDPKNARAHNNLGVESIRQGKPEVALTYYETAIQLDPKFAGAYDNLGYALATLGKQNEAIVAYRKAIQLDPSLTQAYNHLGVALKNQGKLDEAIELYRKVIELDPENADAHNNLGNVQSNLGKLNEAIEFYRTAIQLDPKYALAHNGIGNALYKQGKPEESIIWYRKAIQLDPKLTIAHFNLGNRLQAAGMLDHAIACYRNVIKLDPGYAVCHYNLGCILANKDRLDDAVDCWRTAIKLNPKDIHSLTNLGLALKNQGKLKEAIACYRRAIDLDPNQASYHKSVAKLLSQSRDDVGSCAAYREVIRIRPDDSATLNTLAWVLATDTNPELRNAAEAVELAGRAVELAPKEWAYWDTLAVAAHASENWSESLRARETMLTLKPGQVVDLFYLAIANEKLGDHEAALDYYFPATAQARSKSELTLRDETEQLFGFNADDRNELVSAHYADPPPENADANYWIARGAWNIRLNKWDRAAEAYSKVLALEPEASKYWDPYTKSLVFSGQLTEYRAFCKKLLDQYGETDDSQVARSITGRLLIGPDAVDDWSKPLKLAELLLSQDGTKPHVSEIYCRAGKYQQSLDLCAEAIAEAGREANGWDCFWQAMAHRGLGDHERANELASNARRLADSGELGAKNLNVFNLMFEELKGTLNVPAKEDDE